MRFRNRTVKELFQGFCQGSLTGQKAEAHSRALQEPPKSRFMPNVLISQVHEKQRERERGVRYLDQSWHLSSEGKNLFAHPREAKLRNPTIIFLQVLSTGLLSTYTYTKQTNVPFSLVIEAN